ncbi:MBL fold metallo-hydrolase [Candidatus Bipolaricaulota bacterium]|nr:MBL fold metallo-hydrolase [Candidatus Bipolaricaulota bacterium]
MNERTHPFTHGGVSGAVIQVLESAQWDLNRMLPESLQLSPAHSTVTYTYACAVIVAGGHQTMVDAGFRADEVVGALQTLSIAPKDIERVLITHGDSDHVAGLLTESEALTFPNARYVLSASLWQHWHDAANLDAVPANYKAFCRRLSSALAGRVSTFAEEAEIVQGMRFIPCPGHRHGHAVYEFRTAASPILHFGDTLFHPLFAENPHWPDTMALDPAQEVASRRRLLERAATTHALVLTGHIPFPGLGTIQRHGAAFRWQPTTG